MIKIYPRANVDKSEYDGNRWDYETTCNQLGWKLCWLNKDQLFGRRGLIQRTVDSYRNRHAEMRSRRVTRQEKVANGTLRKRRSKKSLASNMLWKILSFCFVCYVYIDMNKSKAYFETCTSNGCHVNQSNLSNLQQQQILIWAQPTGNSFNFISLKIQKPPHLSLDIFFFVFFPNVCKRWPAVQSISSYRQRAAYSVEELCNL